MLNFKIILLILMFTLSSCGKSPLFNKVNSDSSEINGKIQLNEQFPNKNINFFINWIIKPSLEELSSFELKLMRDLPINQTLNAFIWMPEMGHGSSPIEISRINNNEFLMSEIAFIMPGLWVVHLEILENNQVIDQWQKSIFL